MLDLREMLSLPAWDSLTAKDAEAVARDVERRVPGARFVGLEEHRGIRHIAVFEVDGVEMVLVPGAVRKLGFDESMLDASALAAWTSSFQEEGHAAQQILGGPDVGRPPPEDMREFLHDSLSARRDVTIAPFLLERDCVDGEDDAQEEAEEDPHVMRAERIVASGFRLPTADEWEHACSGGSDTFFRWGNRWPLDTDVYDGGPFEEHAAPNAFGLRYGTSPYQPEIIDDPEQLQHGDGGGLVCGEAGPMAWITFSSWYRYRLRVIDDRQSWLEDARWRRARSIFPEPGEGAVRPYRAPTLFESAELARARLLDAVDDTPGLVLDEDECEQLREELPELEQILQAHAGDSRVLTLGSFLQSKLGEFDAALATARRAVALNRDWRELTALGTAHRVRGEIDEAVRAYEEAGRCDPDGVSLGDAADALASCGRWAEAVERLERALEQDPEYGYARAMLPYARFHATGDRRHIAELRAYVRGDGSDNELAQALLGEIAPSPRRKPKKKKAPKKKLSKKKTVDKRAPQKRAGAKKVSKKASRKKAKRRTRR